MIDIAQTSVVKLYVHRTLAVVLSLLWPGLGLAYLGKTTSDPWSVKPVSIGLAVSALLVAGSYNAVSAPHIVVLALMAWSLLVAASGMLTWGVARRSSQVRPWKEALWPIILLLAAYGFVGVHSRAAELTIVSAPPTASPLLPAGTWLFAVEFDPDSDTVRRGQMVAYRDDGEVKMARVIGVPGDVVRVASRAFLVNGTLHSEALPNIERVSETLFDPRMDNVVGPEVLASGEFVSVTVVRSHGLMVEDDYDLAALSERTLTPEPISIDDVIAIPVAEVWNGGLGPRLIQPGIQ